MYIIKHRKIDPNACICQSIETWRIVDEWVGDLPLEVEHPGNGDSIVL
jgi:hypothetical protein